MGSEMCIRDRDIEVPAGWREWLELGLAGCGPPLTNIRERVRQATRTRTSARLRYGMGAGEGTKVTETDPSPSARPSQPTAEERRRARRRRRLVNEASNVAQCDVPSPTAMATIAAGLVQCAVWHFGTHTRCEPCVSSWRSYPNCAGYEIRGGPPQGTVGGPKSGCRAGWSRAARGS